MINLTDPQLAHLVARYRAWVEEQNCKNSKPVEGMLPGTDMPCATYFIANYQGFLDWAIREGIEVPEATNA